MSRKQIRAENRGKQHMNYKGQNIYIRQFTLIIKVYSLWSKVLEYM